MTAFKVPDALQAETLLEHVRRLSVDIGPRCPNSQAEREAAAYIHRVIRQIGPDWEIINQPFRSIDGLRYRIAPLAALAGISLLAGIQRKARHGTRRKLISGLFSIGLSVLSRDAFLHRAALWETWLPRGESENVIVRIPSRKAPRRRVVLVAHRDSGVHRLTADERIVRFLPRTLGAITALALTGGVLTLLSGRNQRWRTLRGLIGLSTFGGAALSVIDEQGPIVQGANSNASGVAVLLGLAEVLKAAPLESTEVVLVFTGAATAVASGAERLAAQYGAEWKDALWVVVSSVGKGELCWGTRHGISPYAYYHPHPDAVKVMAEVADARPDLGLMGKPMLSVDELAVLSDHHLRAVALMGYDRVTGLIPNWRRQTDTLETLDPATLERAAQAVVTVVRWLDQAPSWPG